MHDIWNPWHGCVKCSEGCEHCYMYYLDHLREQEGSNISCTKNGFRYPLSKNRQGHYKIQSGELIRVCMMSDFFLEQADVWRVGAWDIIRKRRDVKFLLLTKRPERVLTCLPSDWQEGWENVIFYVTCENHKRADERIPILLNLPFKHKGIMVAPFIGEVLIKKYLETGQIEQVICGGENYGGNRPCDFEWVKQLHHDCVKTQVNFSFIETGTHFIKDGKPYHLPSKKLQSTMAHKAQLNIRFKDISFKLMDDFENLIPNSELYIPHYKKHCFTCGSLLICNGCSDCGKCQE